MSQNDTVKVLDLLMILTATSRIVYCRWMALQTSIVLRSFQASRFQGICYLQLWRLRCCLFYQWDTECFFLCGAFLKCPPPQKFILTLSMTHLRPPHLGALCLQDPSEPSFLHLFCQPCPFRPRWLSCSRCLSSFRFPWLFTVLSDPWSSPLPSICPSFRLTPFRFSWPLLVSSKSQWQGSEV